MKKIFFSFLLFLFGCTLFPTPTFAIDQRCWTKSKCIEARTALERMAGQNPADGFVQNAETIRACGKSQSDNKGKDEELGFCLPVGSTETKISFGGRTKFSDVGDFIQYMYRYGIMAAGIISVIIIIVAGMQWAVSGGNSSTIESAKQRINGAVIGLTIAALSYSILNFVNPNLVNFRLPGIWMINTIEDYGKYCDKVPPEKRLGLLQEKAAKNLPLSSKETEKKYAEAKFVIEPGKATCGDSFLVQDGQGLSCLGTSCEIGQVCDIKNSECKPGVIAGKIYNSNLTTKLVGGETFFGSWLWNSGLIARHSGWITDGAAKEAMQLDTICNEALDQTCFLFNKGCYNYIAATNENAMTTDNDKREQYYILPMADVENTLETAINDCKSKGGLKGFILEVGMHEATKLGAMTETHFLGQKNSAAIDLGDSDAIAWVLGRPGTESLLITPDQIRKGLILDINVDKIYNNEDDTASIEHYKNIFQ